MAGRIAGITIEIGGDTTKLQSALKGVDKTLKTTQSNLKDINKLLKLDPKNTELLSQKQKNLETAIKATKDRLTELKNAQSQVSEGSAEWDNLQREIIATEQDLQKLESEYHSFGSVAKQQVIAVGNEMKELGSKIENVGKKFQPISNAATGLLASMGAMGYKAVTAADDLNTLSKQTGVSTADIQKMQYAADRIDVSFDDISGALKKMKPKMTDNNQAFKDLGVSIRDSKGNLRSANDVFIDAVKALSKIDNETERDQKAMELFGKSADSLAGVIDDGGAALKEYGDEAERLGMILDQDTLDSLNETNDAIDKMKAQLQGSMLQAGAKIAEAAAPIVEKLAAGLEKLAGWLATITPQQMELAMKIAAVVALVAPVLIIIGKIVTVLGTLITGIGMLLSPIGLVIAAIAAVIAIGVLLYTHWDELKAKAIAFAEGVKAGFEQLKNDVSNAVERLRTSAINTFENLKSRVGTIWENIKNAITRPFEQAWNTVSGIVERIKNMFNFTLSFPHISLPHFTWSWNDLGLIKIPNISVEWYKKAYDQPYLFSSPTVIGNRGFGDGNGAEMVYGKDSLMKDIKQALSSVVGDQPIVITVQSILDGKIVGQSVTNYQRSAARAMG